MRSLPGEGSVNQFALPWVAASGQRAEVVLTAAEFEAWQTERMGRCGHPNGDVETCRMCQGGMMVLAALGGSDAVKVLPMR